MLCGADGSRLADALDRVHRARVSVVAPPVLPPQEHENIGAALAEIAETIGTAPVVLGLILRPAAATVKR
jgi:hypothetical protein